MLIQMFLFYISPVSIHRLPFTSSIGCFSLHDPLTRLPLMLSSVPVACQLSLTPHPDAVGPHSYCGAGAGAVVASLGLVLSHAEPEALPSVGFSRGQLCCMETVGIPPRRQFIPTLWPQWITNHNYSWTLDLFDFLCFFVSLFIERSRYCLFSSPGSFPFT